jgi:homocitrate synthase NifV
MEEVVMALKYTCAINPNIDTGRFAEISRYVAQASSRPVPHWKAVVGERVFSHESGLHTDGVLKNPDNYEGFSPAEVGLQRHLICGKHSGRHGLEKKLQELNIVTGNLDLNLILDRVRDLSCRYKSALSDQDLVHICCGQTK